MEKTTTRKKLPETEPGMVATQNGTGFMFTELSPINLAFANFAAVCTKPIVDIGCAYGLSTLHALERSDCDVLAVDLSSAHLAELRAELPNADAHRVSTQVGRFPDAPELEDGSVSAIHMSNMFHFLRPHEIELGLDRCLRALEPGGRLFIDTASIYFAYWSQFLPVYEERAAAGERYPGEIANMYDYWKPIEGQDPTPVIDPFLHLFKLEDLSEIVRDAGFDLLFTAYMDRSNLSARYENGGRGWIGIIAERPAH